MFGPLKMFGKRVTLDKVIIRYQLRNLILKSDALTETSE